MSQWDYSFFPLWHPGDLWKFLVLPAAGWDLMDGKMCGFIHCGRLPPLLGGTWFQLVVWYQIFQPRPETWWWIHWIFFPNCWSTSFLLLCFVSLHQSSDRLTTSVWVTTIDTYDASFPFHVSLSIGAEAIIIYSLVCLKTNCASDCITTGQLIITSLSVLAEKFDSNCQLNPPWKEILPQWEI